MPINPAVDAYVLEGRIATMGPRGVIDDGRIYLQGRLIKAVGPATDPVPPGFANAPSVAPCNAFQAVSRCPCRAWTLYASPIVLMSDKLVPPRCPQRDGTI